MVTVTPTSADLVRIDGWVAPGGGRATSNCASSTAIRSTTADQTVASSSRTCRMASRNSSIAPSEPAVRQTAGRRPPLSNCDAVPVTVPRMPRRAPTLHAATGCDDVRARGRHGRGPAHARGRPAWPRTRATTRPIGRQRRRCAMRVLITMCEGRVGTARSRAPDCAASTRRRAAGRAPRSGCAHGAAQPARRHVGEIGRYERGCVVLRRAGALFRACRRPSERAACCSTAATAR